MRLFDWLVIVLLVAMVLQRVALGPEAVPPGPSLPRAPGPGTVAEPPPPLADEAGLAARVAAPPRQTLPVSLVVGRESTPRRGDAFTGTAWALAGSDLWLSARHVTDDCRILAFGDGIRLVPARGHPAEDVSAIAVGRRHAQGLRFAADPLRAGEAVFLYGFPGGRPAAVWAEAQGRAAVRHAELGTVYAGIVLRERARKPLIRGHLGGISGGPALDGDGNVVGAVTSGDPRRARITLAGAPALAALAGTLGAGPATVADRPARTLTPDSFVAAAPDLLRRSVRQVVCRH